MAACERNNIVYIITTECRNLLKIGYIDHKTNKRLPEITSAEPFKYCYFRYVYDGKDIYERIMDRFDNVDDDDDVLEDDGYIKVSNMKCNSVKYIIDLIVKDFDKVLSPPPYRP